MDRALGFACGCPGFKSRCNLLPVVPNSNPVLISFRLSRIRLYLPVGVLNNISVKFELFLSDHFKWGACELA